jgi:hypothetical protein
MPTVYNLTPEKLAVYRATAQRRREQERSELEHCRKQAWTAARRRPEDQDLFIDSAALSLHDFYAGLERIFHQIATTVDGSLPADREWHRDLLQQMQADLPDLRPPVLSREARQAVDEFLRFRHVVRNIYAFQFDPERVERLVQLAQQADLPTSTVSRLLLTLEQVGAAERVANREGFRIGRGIFALASQGSFSQYLSTIARPAAPVRIG